MCELVKRNNGGRLRGQLWEVDPNLIELVKRQAKENFPAKSESPGWEKKSSKDIKKIIVNGVPVTDLARVREGTSSLKVISMFTLPGGRRVTLPLIAEKEAGQPNLFLDTESRIKIH